MYQVLWIINVFDPFIKTLRTTTYSEPSYLEAIWEHEHDALRLSPIMIVLPDLVRRLWQSRTTLIWIAKQPHCFASMPPYAGCELPVCDADCGGRSSG